MVNAVAEASRPAAGESAPRHCGTRTPRRMPQPGQSPSPSPSPPPSPFLRVPLSLSLHRRRCCSSTAAAAAHARRRRTRRRCGEVWGGEAGSALAPLAFSPESWGNAPEPAVTYMAEPAAAAASSAATVAAAATTDVVATTATAFTKVLDLLLRIS